MRENLDDICDGVMDVFANAVVGLSNSECEYVLNELIQKLDGLLERVKELATIS